MSNLNEQTCKLICPISAAMVGVCLTTIGLMRIISSVGQNTVSTYVDDLLAVNAIMFLIATLTSYAALRTRTDKRLHRLERVADLFFIGSMILLTAICFVITYAIGSL
jgi:drug/metabolite transporter (DMT)-like permease